MKLKKEFIPHDTGKESLLLPTGSAGFAGLVKGNRTLGVILEYLRNDDLTESEIIAAMKERFDAPEGVIEKDVRRAIAELRRIGALNE